MSLANIKVEVLTEHDPAHHGILLLRQRRPDDRPGGDMIDVPFADVPDLLAAIKDQTGVRGAESPVAAAAAELLVAIEWALPLLDLVEPAALRERGIDAEQFELMHTRARRAVALAQSEVIEAQA